MAYVLLKTMKYNTETNSQYIYKVVDELVSALSQVGVSATGKKFGNAVDLSNSSNLTDNNMPSWIAKCALSRTSINWVFNRSYSSYAYNAGSKCIGCVYWELDGIKYVYFLGGGYSNFSDSSNSPINDTLIQYMYVDGATDTEQRLTIGSTHDNYNVDYSYFGYANTPDRFSIARTANSFHFYVKGRNSEIYNMYAGHVTTSYGDSLVNPKYGWMTKIPIHNNMTKNVIIRSFGTECSSMINKSDGDIPTGKYYSFDVFYGIQSGTIIGIANETKCIPYLPSANGDIVSVGGDIYLRIGEVSHSYTSSYDQPLLVKVN